MKNNFSVFIIALAVCVSFGIFFNGCASEPDTTAVDALEKEKKMLLSSIDSLQNLYGEMVETADTLTAGIEKANAMIASKDEEVAAMRKKAGKAEKNAAALGAEVAQLQQTKAEYEKIVAGMRDEITKLGIEKDGLIDDLDAAGAANEALQYEIEDLKLLVRGMEEELDQRRIDGVKATNLRFETLKNNNKTTGSNNRARTVLMDFDLNDVPEQVQGEVQLYFVIRNAKTGVPIKSNNPINATIKPKRGAAYSFIAQESKTVTLGTNQRLEMKHDLETKLEKGAYRALVYSDLGLIGAVGFRLR